MERGIDAVGVGLEPAGAPWGTRGQLLVIGAGLGRTGTLSLKLGLEQLLGRPCYHMIEVLHQPRHHELWSRVFREEQAHGAGAGWAKFGHAVQDALAPFSAAVDLPTHMFYRELLKANPAARVILTVRDFDAWYTSCLNTIYQAHLRGESMPWYAAMLHPFFRRHLPITRSYFGPSGLFKGRFEDKGFAQQVYNEYIQSVKDSVPPGQLLVYEVSQGWAPLCEFLDLPVPSEPFPRVNDTTTFQQRARTFRRKAQLLIWGPPVALAVLLGAAGAAAMHLARAARGTP